MTALRRIGGPNAISGWTFLLTLVVFAIATLLPTSRDQVTGPGGARLAVALLATLAAFVVLLVARLTVLRSGERPVRPGVALAVFALSGVVQALALIVLRPAFDLEPIEPVLLIATRAAAGVVWLSIVAILVDEVRSHNARVAELVARIATLEAVRAREEAERATAAAALRDEILGPLRDALDAIGTRLAAVGGAGRAQAEADALRRLVEDEVRPASHALLDREADARIAGHGPVMLPRAERARIVLRLAATSLAAPTWLAIGLPLVIVLLFAVQDVGLAFVVMASVGYVLLMAGCLALARRMLEPRLPRMRTARAAAVALLTYEAMAVVAIVNNWVWGWLSPLGRWIEWPSLFVLPAIWIGIAVSRAAQAKREATEARLAAVVAELSAIEARRRQGQRHDYQRLGRLLHGDVQGSLLAVARRLDEAGDLPADARTAAADAAADQLHAVITRIRAAPVEDWTAARALADIAALWDGAAAVRLTCDAGALARVDAAPATRTALVDVVAEAVTNAVRHGAAQAIEVRLALLGVDRVALDVVDDGRAPKRGAPGMGARLFDEVSPRWSLDTAAGGARLHIELVLDDAPVAASAGA